MPKRRDEQAPYWQQLRVAEKGIIEFALEHGKTIRGTAVLLGISPNYLGERIHLLGIPVPDVRPGPKPGTKRPAPAAPQLRVVSEDPPPEEAQDGDGDEEDTEGGEDNPNDDVLEDETEEGQDDAEEDDPWDEDRDEDEDEDDSDGQDEPANVQRN